MNSRDVRQKFHDFFIKSEYGGHVVVSSSSLIPENDPSVLFTTAGMQQFKPYYIGDKSALTDFGSRNVVTIQKCVRTGDIDEVGDNTHLTFFEMLGNFSFGGYGKKEAIAYAHEFMTKELGLEISYVTFYKGSDSVPRDDESEMIWRSLGIDKENIREDGADVFWGPTGNGGPCGPTTEIYCKNAAGQDVEVWNIVFNQYFCNGSREQLDKGEVKLEKLDTFGIDTGMGFERLMAVVQDTSSVFETDLFKPIIDGFPDHISDKIKRIISDHSKTAAFLISEGVVPSNKEQGYILRRLLRRTIAYLRQGQAGGYDLFTPFQKVIEIYDGIYPLDKARIFSVIKTEAEQFDKALTVGLKEFEKGKDPFILFTTYGFPIELALEIAKEKGIVIDQEEFSRKMKEHQDLSRTSSAGMFKGGLANHNDATVKLHTAHHLLLAALQKVLGPSIKQRGSNITDERLRIDFAFDRKMTNEEKEAVEKIVNESIKADYKVVRTEMPLEEAKKIGAEMEFGAKYSDIVSVYLIGDSSGNYISKEFCGGPHVERTGSLGRFKILKEEASSQGVRRIKAILE